MDLQTLKDRLPAHAKDLKLNLGAVTRSEHLTDEQVWGAFLATALAARDPDVIRAATHEAEQRLSPEALAAARTAAAVMGMNNVYYRFVHLVANEDYARLPARLRMQGLSNPGVDQGTFELWSLAVSAVNGCGMCLDAHDRQVRRELSAEAVQDAVRIAAVVSATSAVLSAETALAGQAA